MFRLNHLFFFTIIKLLICSLILFIFACHSQDTKKNTAPKSTRRSLQESEVKQSNFEKKQQKSKVDKEPAIITEKKQQKLTGFTTVIQPDIENQQLLSFHKEHEVWFSPNYNITKIFSNDSCAIECIRLLAYQKLNNGKEYLYGNDYHTSPFQLIRMNTQGQESKKFPLTNLDRTGFIKLFKTIAVDKEGNIYGGERSSFSPAVASNTLVAIQKMDIQGQITDYLKYNPNWHTTDPQVNVNYIKDLDSVNAVNGTHSSELITDHKGALYSVGHCVICDGEAVVHCKDTQTKFCEMAAVTSIRKMTGPEKQTLFLEGSNVYGDTFDSVTVYGQSCAGTSQPFKGAKCFKPGTIITTDYKLLPPFKSTQGKRDSITTDVRGEDIYLSSTAISYHEDSWKVFSRIIKQEMCPGYRPDSILREVCDKGDLKTHFGVGHQIIRINQEKEIVGSLLFYPTSNEIAEKALPDIYSDVIKKGRKILTHTSTNKTFGLDHLNNIYLFAKFASNLMGLLKITPTGKFIIVFAIKGTISHKVLVDHAGNLYIKNLKLEWRG